MNFQANKLLQTIIKKVPESERERESEWKHTHTHREGKEEGKMVRGEEGIQANGKYGT